MYNKDSIPLFLTVPSADLFLFKSVIGTDYVHYIADEDVCDNLISEKPKWLSAGYINQQIIKLSFWKTKVAENYFCVDSDSYFIRNFFVKDFLHISDIPYTILAQDKELQADPHYPNWDERQQHLLHIRRRFLLDDPVVRTAHGLITLSSQVLNAFQVKFLDLHSLTYFDILDESPFEFSWYTFWLEKDKTIPIIPIEPLIKVFHYRNQYNEARYRGITESYLARSFIGICLNSNWRQRSNNVILPYKDPGFLERLFYRIAMRLGKNRG
ncbi:hypothetical protein [Desulfocurvibacter africanus]|uniref:hypothetical protein n=1 Tax=Desulfocurvibacter africanus TaxID=873 RepID=UPI00110C4F5A|nr:hypothetical protein [Desulfocurvibacter africanus]